MENSDTVDKPTGTKRRRTVTTCSECHRRKQKCDRKQPCNVCLARNVPERCSYGGQATPSQAAVTEVKQTAVVDASSPTDEYPLSPQARDGDIANQIGYSPMSGSNIFADLQQLLKDETVGPSELSNLFKGPLISQHLEGRYWVLIAELPSKDVVEELMGIFLSEVNWYYNMIERYYVLKSLREWLGSCGDINNAYRKATLKGLSRDLQYFPALLFQILAIALQFVPQDALAPGILHVESMEQRERLSRQYSGKGMEVMTILGRHNPTLTAVQQDLLRASWLKNSGRGNESWHALGSATRQAQELNLHLQSKVNASGTTDMSETLDRLWYDEHKRRVWIILFIWDSHMALVLGRPRIINASDCDIKIPLDCNIPENPRATVPSAVHLLEDGGKPSLFTPALLQYSLSQFIHQMRSSGADRRCPKDYNVVLGIHNQVMDIIDSLPLVMRPNNPDTSWDSRCPSLPRQREQVLTAANQLLLALHRTHIHVHSESRARAIQAAFTILEAQQRFFDMTPPHQYRLFGVAFSTIDAASFLAAIMMVQPQPDHEQSVKIQSTLDKVANKLEILGNRNALATSGLKLIRHCQAKFPNRQLSATGADLSQPLNEMIAETSRPPVLEENFVHGPGNISSFEPLNYFDQSLDTFDPSRTLQRDDGISSILDIGGNIPDVNTFDASYWIEQMNQIPAVSEDPEADPVWDTFFG